MTLTKLDPNLKQTVAVGTPVEVVDPATQEVYYLISAEQFRAIATAIAGELDPREAYPLVDLTMAEDDAADQELARFQ